MHRSTQIKPDGLAILATVLTVLIAVAVQTPAAETMSLHGEWRFALDPSTNGLAQAWYKTALSDTIRLPGTTDENQKGARNTNTNEVNHLSRLHPYWGPAWYQRDVVIPEAWKGQRITLLAGEHYCRDEGRRILKAFGNHPSFVMFALGNEMGGGRDVRASVVKELRQFDRRRLYAQASNYDLGQFTLADGDDYWIGQYQVFPNFKETAKYTGVLRAWNFEVFRERLRAQGLLDQADDFFKASGALSVLCYREEIEAALRTPGFGGFQLLDLQDFPGQGTASQPFAG